VHNRVTHQVT